MTRVKLQLNRKFLVIESPIPFEIYCPEQQDGVKRRQGSWQMTIHDLLTKSHYPLNPIYNLELVYDETLLNANEVVSWYTTDLNLGEALRGIDGQLVTFGDTVIETEVKNLPTEISVDNFPTEISVDNFPTEISVDNLKSVECVVNGYGNKELMYSTKFDNITNFIIKDYDFVALKDNRYYYQFRNGSYCSNADGSWTDSNIFGLQIINGQLKFWLEHSNTQKSVSISSLQIVHGYFSGFNL